MTIGSEERLAVGTESQVRPGLGYQVSIKMGPRFVCTLSTHHLDGHLKSVGLTLGSVDASKASLPE